MDTLEKIYEITDTGIREIDRKLHESTHWVALKEDKLRQWQDMLRDLHAAQALVKHGVVFGNLSKAIDNATKQEREIEQEENPYDPDETEYLKAERKSLMSIRSSIRKQQKNLQDQFEFEEIHVDS